MECVAILTAALMQFTLESKLILDVSEILILMFVLSKNRQLEDVWLVSHQEIDLQLSFNYLRGEYSSSSLFLRT